VPSDDGFWLDEEQLISPILEKACEQNPEQPVTILDMRSLCISFQDFKLMSEREAFQGKCTMRPQR
jgi:hypothetical protein